mmetsp:Transcript_84617/g.168039  ORF Transcript_84617/g.168039 Transcript_84617/m.168039 type:complete len:152 (-) Transcript_84617:122-577(-)
MQAVLSCPLCPSFLLQQHGQGKIGDNSSQLAHLIQLATDHSVSFNSVQVLLALGRQMRRPVAGAPWLLVPFWRCARPRPFAWERLVLAPRARSPWGLFWPPLVEATTDNPGRLRGEGGRGSGCTSSSTLGGAMVQADEPCEANDTHSVASS